MNTNQNRWLANSIRRGFDGETVGASFGLFVINLLVFLYPGLRLIAFLGVRGGVTAFCLLLIIAIFVEYWYSYSMLPISKTVLPHDAPVAIPPDYDRDVPQSSIRRRSSVTVGSLATISCIIILLAAMLFPALDQKCELVRQTSCLSNLKEWNLATQMYIQDYDEKLPGLYQQDASPNPQYYGVIPWPVLLNSYVKLNPYVKIDKLKDCPSTGYPSNLGPSDLPFFHSYGWNFLYLGGYGVPEPNLAAIEKPAKCVMFADTYSGLASPYERTGYYAAYAPSFFYSGSRDPRYITSKQWYNAIYISDFEFVGRVTSRHRGGANVAWGDGHCKWVRVPGVITQDDQYWSLQGPAQ